MRAHAAEGGVDPADEGVLSEIWRPVVAAPGCVIRDDRVSAAAKALPHGAAQDRCATWAFG